MMSGCLYKCCVCETKDLNLSEDSFRKIKKHMKVSTINALLTVCLAWAVILFLIFYLPVWVYDNPPPLKPSYDIGGNSEKRAETSPMPVLSLAERLVKGDSAHGRQLYGGCATCHAPQKNGANRVGPPLWGIIGRQVGAIASFNYSRAMRRAAEEGNHWSFETLYIYLNAPQRFIKGTTMSYVGMKDEQDRADLILYLRSLADTPQPLPQIIKKDGAQ